MSPQYERGSGCWVERVAAGADAPWVVLAKRRRGDHAVELTLPPMTGLEGRHPVLVDDIVSSGGTRLAAIRLLRAAGFPRPRLLAVHAVIGREATENLERAGRLELVSCNTIVHPTNRIDVSAAIQAAVEHQLRLGAAGTAAPRAVASAR